MARLNEIPEPMHSHLANLPCPSFSDHPWITGPALSRRRVSLISTAGLHRREDRPFESMTGDYRIIPGDIQAKDLVMTHISTNFDRTGFQQDWNVIFPNHPATKGSLGALRSLAETDESLRMAGAMYLVPLGQA